MTARTDALHRLHQELTARIPPRDQHLYAFQLRAAVPDWAYNIASRYQLDLGFFTEGMLVGGISIARKTLDVELWAHCRVFGLDVIELQPGWGLQEIDPLFYTCATADRLRVEGGSRPLTHPLFRRQPMDARMVGHPPLPALARWEAQQSKAALSALDEQRAQALGAAKKLYLEFETQRKAYQKGRRI